MENIVIECGINLNIGSDICINIWTFIQWAMNVVLVGQIKLGYCAKVSLQN